MMYYVLKLYKLGVFALAGLLVLACIIGLIRLGSMDAVQKKLARRRMGHPAVWALLTVVVLAVNLVFSYLMAGVDGTADIVLNYNKASSGLNPNGTRFNSAEILSDEVLQDAIDCGQLEGVTVDQLRDCLSVKSSVQGNSASRKSYFISTQYRLAYSGSKETSALQPSAVLQLVGDSYKNWFIRQYAENADVLNQDLIDFADLDYLDICDYLHAQAEMVYKYMNRLEKQESGFNSDKTSETFKSISRQASNIQDVMIERLRAYVMENGISKNRDAYMGRLGVDNVFLYFKELTKAASNRNALVAVSMYEDDMARIVLVPTYDKNSQFYMSETRIGVDDYAEEARNYATEKNDLRNKIAVNNHAIEQFRRGQASGKDEKAELLVQQIRAELEHVCQEARTIAQEYYAWESNDYVSVAVRSIDERLNDIVMQAVKYTLLLMVTMFAAYAACAKDPKNNEKRKANREGEQA